MVEAKLDVMINLKYYLIALLTGYFYTSQLQVKKESNLYLCFENDTGKKMYKRHFDQGYIKGKHNEFDLYDYYYTSMPKKKYQFATKYGTEPLIINKAYFKEINPKPWFWLAQLKERLPATYYKGFPYQHVFLIEKLHNNKYKMVEVETYTGDEFP